MRIRRFTAVLCSTSLLAFAVAAPAVSAQSASPNAAPGWPLCAQPSNPTLTHCHTPRECIGNNEVIKYWDYYPYNLNHTEVVARCA